MIISIKDLGKFLGVSVVACLAVFVCTIFLNYNIDIAGIEDLITTETGLAFYDAIVMTGKVVAAVTGGCLGATSLIMLTGYIKNYIDAHAQELGILKALGYSNIQTARHFGILGLSFFIGGVSGFLGAHIYMPAFYEKQNSKGFLPDFAVHFHLELAAGLILAPTVLFAALSVFYAMRKLKKPALTLLRGTQTYRTKIHKKETASQPFLQDLRQSTLRDRKLLVFLVAFSAFCFSAMTQMSMSMKDLSSDSFSLMVLVIGLILAFMTLFLSLTSVVRSNGKTIAMMKVFGYSRQECYRAILGGYRLVSYIGFAVGSAYQYILLKLVVTFVFADFEDMPEFTFSFQALFVSLAAFLVVYELIMYGYARRINQMPVKSIMLE